MKTEEKIGEKILNARYDASMNQYETTVLFPEKLARAKEKFRNVNFEEFVKKLEELKEKKEQ